MKKEEEHIVYTNTPLRIHCYSCHYEWDSGALPQYRCPNCSREAKGKWGL